MGKIKKTRTSVKRHARGALQRFSARRAGDPAPDFAAELRAYAARYDSTDDEQRPKRDRHYAGRRFPVYVARAVELVAATLHPARRLNETAGYCVLQGAGILLRRLAAAINTIRAAEVAIRQRGARDETLLLARWEYTLDADGQGEDWQGYRLTAHEARRVCALHRLLHMPHAHAIALSIMVCLCQLEDIDGETRRVMARELGRFADFLRARAAQAEQWRAQAEARPAPAPFAVSLADILGDSTDDDGADAEGRS